MGTVYRRRLSVVIMFLLFSLISVSPMLNVNAVELPSDLTVVPYIDSVVYREIASQDQQVLALVNGEVDIIARVIDPTYLSALNADEDISLTRTLRNGYGHITINCDKYPFNISAFRRAFAYAFNKTQVNSELLLLNIMTQEHDSVVPYANGWCIEDELPYHYYDAQVETGADILDDAGFEVVSGFRRAPDGSPFDVSIQWTNMTPLVAEVGNIVSRASLEALAALNIDASSGPIWPHINNLTERIDNNEDFDMAFYAYNFPNTDLDWLGYHFWSELADVPFANPCNFRNAKYDSWRTQLLQGADYEEVYEAAAAMQRILHENVPLVVVYENVYTHAFRNDLFTSHIVDPLLGIHDPLNLMNMRRSDGSSGGTVRVAISSFPNTFNIYLPANEGASLISSQLWPSLYLKGPDNSSIPYLATDVRRETYTDDSSIPQEYTRFTIDIVQNARWTDNTSLTAYDVVYSLKYAFESGAYGNPAGESLTKLVSVYAPSLYRVVIEFESDSYWHFSRFAYDYIIPKHIYENVDYGDWTSWDSVFWNTTDPYVTAGPFSLEQYVPGDFVELSANPDFWFHPYITTTTGPDSDFIALILGIGGAIGGGIVVILAIINFKKRR